MPKEDKLVRKLYAQLFAQDFWYVFPSRGTRLTETPRKGVYVIADKNQRVLHVGSTPKGEFGIEARLESHLYGRSSFARKFLKQKKIDLRDGGLYCYIKVANPRIRLLLEAYAIGSLCPAHLGLHKSET